MRCWRLCSTLATAASLIDSSRLTKLADIHPRFAFNGAVANLRDPGEKCHFGRRQIDTIRINSVKRRKPSMAVSVGVTVVPPEANVSVYATLSLSLSPGDIQSSTIV